MKKMILIILGGLAVLLLAVFAVGFMLPERYDATVSVIFTSPPEKVWAAVSDYQAHPMASGQRKSTQKQPDEGGLPVWVEDYGPHQVTVRTVSATAPAHLKRHMTDNVVPMSVDWELRIDPANGGSRVTATSQTTVRRGTWHVPIFRVILKMGGAEKSIRDYWSSIAKTLGETPQFAQ